MKTCTICGNERPGFVGLTRICETAKKVFQSYNRNWKLEDDVCDGCSNLVFDHVRAAPGYVYQPPQDMDDVKIYVLTEEQTRLFREAPVSEFEKEIGESPALHESFYSHAGTLAMLEDGKMHWALLDADHKLLAASVNISVADFESIDLGLYNEQVSMLETPQSIIDGPQMNETVVPREN